MDEVHTVEEAREHNEEAASVQGSREVLKRTIDSMIEEMKAREIKTDEDYRFLDDWQKKAKATIKTIDEAFEDERVEKKAPYDKVLEKIREMKRPIDLALPIVVKKMTDYVTEREKARRAEVARLEAESVKRKEDDRIVEAENLTAMGRADKADEVMGKKVTVSRAAVAAAAPAKLGKTAERWVVTITDKSAFLKFAAVAAMEIFEAVDVNTAKLEAIARKNKGLSAPGLKVEQTFVPVA
jgi:hypothetical protein